MPHLELTQGKLTILCDEGYEFAKWWKWYIHEPGSHAARSVNLGGKRRKTLYLHVELAKYFGFWEKGCTIDHKDRNGLNNSIDNLRQATRTQQNVNRGKKVGMSSEYIGVCWNKRNSRWLAQIRINGKVKHLGYFEDERDAAEAYQQASKLHNGEFTPA